MATIRVRPVEGRSLPIDGAWKRRVEGEMDVPDTAYYRRALRRGDIQLVEPQGEAPAPKAPRKDG